MENASQALMIAAGVLIGILILSLGVYLFTLFGNHVSTTEKEIAHNMLAQFNEKFLKYNGLENLTIQDVITVKNYALDNNLSYSGYTRTAGIADGTNDYVDVYISGTWILGTGTTDENLLNYALQIPEKYSCKVLVSEQTGRVYKIIFTKT